MNIKEIAQLAGVSKTTASRAFSNPGLVKPATLQRVMAIAKQHNFKPNAMAQAVASRKSGLIGFCLYNKSQPYFGHTFFGPVLDGVVEWSKKFDYHVVLATTDKIQDTFEESFIEDSIEGAILSTFMPAKMAAIFHSRGIPVVILNDEYDSPNTGCVVDDNYGGATTMMNFLINEHGYDDIAFVSNRLSHTSNMLRYIGYLDALKGHDLKPYDCPQLPDCDLLVNVREYNHLPLTQHGYKNIPRMGKPVIISELTSQIAYKEVQPLLNSRHRPRAIFCTSDTIAVGVIHAIRDRGLRVPQDIAVTGYDDIDAATVCEPAITTIAVNREGMGTAAVELLHSYIADPSQPSRTVCVGNKLVVRQST